MKWFLGAILLLGFAVAYGLGLLALAMYVVLAVMVASRGLAQVWINSLEATRECGVLAAEIGDRVEVIVSVRNRGRLPIPWFLFEDLLPQRALTSRPPQLAIEGGGVKLGMLWGGKSVAMGYRLTCRRRGYFQIGPAVLETGDLFGLHRRFRVATEPHFLLVYPKVIPLVGYDVTSRRPIGEVRMSYRLFEDPTRMAGARRYAPGDPLNRVHWRATARTGQLHSKIYEPSTVSGATIVLEMHRAAYDPKYEPHGSDLAVTAAASIAHALYQMGQQVGLITNGRDAADRVQTEGWEGEVRSREAARKSAELAVDPDRRRPVVVQINRSPELMRRVLQTLARVELGDGLKLSQLLMETDCRMPRDASVLVILQAVTTEAAIVLGNLRRRGYAVTAILCIYDNFDYAAASGVLAAEGVRSVQLREEAAIATVCMTCAVGGGRMAEV